MDGIKRELPPFTALAMTVYLKHRDTGQTNRAKAEEEEEMRKAHNLEVNY